MMGRETYYTALFAQLQTLLSANNGPFSVVSRKPKPAEEHSGAELPALYMLVSHQPVKQDDGSPPIHELQATLILHAACNDRYVSGDIAINDLLDAVETVLGPDNPVSGTYTLGGLVQHCRIEGRCEIYAGVDGTRAAGIVPISIVVP